MKIQEQRKMFVWFSLASDAMALPIEVVKEAVNVDKIVPVPRAPKFVEGVMNLRGEVLPIISLAKLLGSEVEQNECKKVIVTYLDGAEAGLLVKEIKGILRVSEADVSPLSEVAKEAAQAFSGAIRRDDDLISEILESDPQITVVARARDGLDALEKIEQFDPDLITLDLNMPVMDGLEALKRIMENRPRPVVVVSSLTQEEAPITMQVLDLGAVDYIPKPSGTISLDIKKISQEIVAKVKAAAGIDPKKISRPRPRRDFVHKAEESRAKDFAGYL